MSQRPKRKRGGVAAAAHEEDEAPAKRAQGDHGAAAAAGSASAAAAAPAAPEAASAAAAAASAPPAPRIPQEPLDRRMPGPPLTCESFTYAPDGDAAAKEHFSCPASLQPLYDPVQCKKGHYNCRDCLKKGGSRCAVCGEMCRAAIDVGLGVKAVLDGLKVECPDCGIVITRDRLPNHRDNVCPLPCVRACGATVSRSAAAAHESVCQQLLVSCDAAEYGCPWKGTRQEQANHTAACGLNGVLPALRLMSDRITKLRDAHDAQDKQIQLLKRENAAQAKLIKGLTDGSAAQTARVTKLEVQVAELDEENREQELRIGMLRDQLDEHTAPLEWHELGDAFCKKHGVKLRNGWDPDKRTFRFAKDAHGFVHLDGFIKGGKPDDDKAVLTLSEDFRPLFIERLAADSGRKFGEVKIVPSGELQVRVAYGGISSGMTFFAE